MSSVEFEDQYQKVQSVQSWQEQQVKVDGRLENTVVQLSGGRLRDKKTITLILVGVIVVCLAASLIYYYSNQPDPINQVEHWRSGH